ncbi:MAG TPA: ATP-binding cassette domain-containing protein [Rectinemataceae bacterium]|nr:ATP-binding cassette domain-containing protein [Rectinemataceae bacterium]
MPLLVARGLRKFYASTGVLANDDVSLSVDGGEIVAVVGENGAGKSTFARIVAGLVAPDSGEVEIRGRSLRGGDVREAEKSGIGLVPQHSFLAEGLEVAESICLGREAKRFGLFLDRRRMREETAALAKSAGIDLDLTRRVRELSPADRRHAEILRALAWSGDLLILDEPTSLLDDEESARLFELIRRLADSGRAIIFISHRSAELAAIATRIVVLRSGKLVADRAVGDFAPGELPALMSRSRVTAGESDATDKLEGMTMRRGRVVAASRGLGLSISRGRVLVDFEVRERETLGVVALAGNGLEELESIAAGLSAPMAGRFELEGRDVRDWPRRQLRSSLAAYVPSDREGRGLALEASIGANLTVLEGSPRRTPGFPPVLGPTGDMRRKATSLSGGNRQRLVLSRELAKPRAFFLLADPSQGLDISGVAELSGIIAARKTEGGAILLLSSSIEETLRLADRIIVLYRGAVVWEGANLGEGMAHELASHLTGHSRREALQ